MDVEQGEVGEGVEEAAVVVDGEVVVDDDGADGVVRLVLRAGRKG